MPARQKLSPRRKPLLTRPLVIGAVFLLLLGSVGYVWLSHRTKPNGSSPTAGQYTKGEPAASGSDTSNKSGDTSTGTGSTNQPGDDKNADSNSNAALVAPTGNFVSNHHPGMGSQLSSDCTTTPGATCSISFTKDGVTKSLAAQTTDRGGTTFWAWKPSDLGLSQGTWKISVTATLGSQTKTATDAIDLEVGP